MEAWTKVITEPLGLAGFALFVLFTYLGKLKSDDKRRWPAPVAFSCAALALGGGLALAYLGLPKPTVQTAPTPATTPAPSAAAQEGPVVQTGTVNMNKVQGDYTVVVDQATGKAKIKPAAPHKAPSSSESK